MTVTILEGDARLMLMMLPSKSINCCVTSPPYFGLRDYGCAGQIGLEETPGEFVETLVRLFREVRRVLRDDGTVWLNLGDSYATGTKAPRKPTTITGKHVPASWAGRSQPERCGTPDGMKTKDLIGIPWWTAFALRTDGWYLRSDIIWHKPNPMPESVTDRPTSAHEHLFLLAKSERYYYDVEAIKEPVSVPDWNDGSRVYGDINKAGANLQHGHRTTGRRTGKGNAKSFRGGGAYTKSQSFDNNAKIERETHGNVPNESGLRNRRNVWTIPPKPFKGAHFATFPPALIEPCIKAGCPEGGMVLDPFGGAGTTGLVAQNLNRNATLIELNPVYALMARERIDAARLPGLSD